MKRITLSVLILLYLQIPFVYSQELSPKDKRELLEKLKIELEKSYIIESTAIEMVRQLENNIKIGKYDTISNNEEFAFEVTKDLRDISKDLHLEFLYSEESLNLNSKEKDDKEEKWLQDLLQQNGHGIKHKEILAGNIAYLNIPFFGPISHCAETLFEAMDFVSETDALIIDLRECRGSLDADMIPLFCGYFFDEPIHLFDFENRENNTIRQFWSAAYVPGKKYLNKPIYLLTSGRTFSGGEEFAYDMKHLGRAILIGEVTKGGAQPKYPVYLNEHFLVTIPKERSVNAVTKTNWEQVGVQPDIESDATKALSKAHYMAVKNIISKSEDSAQIESLKAVLSEIKKNEPEFKKVKFKLKGFLDAKEVYVSGSFNFWTPKKNQLVKDNDGWSTELEVSIGSHSYKFVVDDRWITDPANPNIIEENGRKNSLLIVQE